MGLIVEVYKNPKYHCTNGGVTETVDQLTLVNVSGPFEPTEERPAAMLVPNSLGSAVIVPAVNVAKPGEKPFWVALDKEGQVGPMAGGNYAGTSDGRFSEAVARILGHGFYGALPVHDRYETVEQYRALSI